MEVKYIPKIPWESAGIPAGFQNHLKAGLPQMVKSKSSLPPQGSEETYVSHKFDMVHLKISRPRKRKVTFGNQNALFFRWTMLEFRGGVSDPNGKFGGENHRVKKWRRLDGICDPSLWNQGQPVGMKDIRKTRKSWFKKKQSSHKKTAWKAGNHH